MTFQMIIAMIIVIVIIIGGCLPRLYIDFKYFQSFIEMMKKIVRTICETIKNNTYEDGNNENIEAEVYYTKKLVFFVIKHKKEVLFLCLFVLIGVVFLCKWISIMPQIDNPRIFENILSSVDIVAFLGYWLCKSEKRKWQYSLVLIILDILRISWKVLIMHSPFIAMDTMLLIFWIVIFLRYYYQWQKIKDICFFDLQQKMQNLNIENEKLLKNYQILLEQHHDNKKHFNMLYHLNQEKEIMAMQDYLKQLEQERKQSHASL